MNQHSHPLLARAFVLLTFLFSLPALAASSELTPADVYAEALRIEQETALIKRHFNITGTNPAPVVEVELMPRHVWVKSYMLLVQISLLRRQKGLPYVTPAYLEPTLELDSSYIWGQTQRILTEISLLKQHLGIAGQNGPAPRVSGKRPVDVFNKLNQISYDWSLLLEGGISPDQVFGETLRLNEDVNSLLRLAGVSDNVPPPGKNPAGTPADTLQVANEVLAEIQRLQRQLNLPVTSLEAFVKPAGKISEEEVFNVVSLLLAELQTIKAQRGLVHKVTPNAPFVQGRKPADVAQLLGYVRNKLRLIRSF